MKAGDSEVLYHVTHPVGHISVSQVLQMHDVHVPWRQGSGGVSRGNALGHVANFPQHGRPLLQVAPKGCLRRAGEFLSELQKIGSYILDMLALQSPRNHAGLSSCAQCIPFRPFIHQRVRGDQVKQRLVRGVGRFGLLRS